MALQRALGGGASGYSGLVNADRNEYGAVDVRTEQILHAVCEDGEDPQKSEFLTRYTGTRSYLISAGGYIGIQREYTQLELRISEGGDHLELTLLQRRELAVIAFVLPSEQEEKGLLTCGKCCTGSCALGRNGCSVRQALETPALRRVKEWGTEVIYGHLFPLFSKYGRAAVALFELLTALVMLAVALPTFVNKAKRGSIPPTDIVRLSISCTAVFLAVINAAFANRTCTLCELFAELKSRLQPRKRTRPRSSNAGLEPKPDEPKPDKPKPKNTPLSLLEKVDKYFSDTIRLLIAELLIYPTVICNIVDNATREPYKGDASEKFAFARFILSSFWLVVHVYLFRLVVIGGTIVLLEKKRRGKGVKTVYTNVDGTERVELWEDSKIRWRARRGIILEIFFLIHVFGQMVTQGLMLGAIWSKFQCENPDPEISTVYISPFTWVMIVLGFIVPLAGTFTFFIPTYFWAQEFPIDFMVTMLTALKKRSLLKIKDGAEQTVKELEELLQNIKRTLTAHKENLCRKIIFPLLTPHLVILSCIYDVVLLFFAIFYFFGRLESGEYVFCHTLSNYTESLNITSAYDYGDELGAVWWIYYVVGVGLVNIANIIVVLIGLFWMVVMPNFLYSFPVIGLVLFFPVLFITYGIRLVKALWQLMRSCAHKIRSEL